MANVYIVLQLQKGGSGGHVFNSQFLTGTIFVPAASMSMAGQLPSLPHAQALPAGSMVMGGRVPTIVSGANPAIAMPAASLVMTAQVINVFGIEDMDIFETMPIFADNISASMVTGVPVPAASMVMTGRVPSISTNANNSIIVPAVALVMSPKLPVVATSGNQVVNINVAGSMVMTANPPTIVVSTSTPPNLRPDPRFYMGAVPATTYETAIVE